MSHPPQKGTEEISDSRFAKTLGNWKAYAAAAGATLSMATNADASIIYSGPLNLTVSVSTSALWSTAPSVRGSGKHFSIGGIQAAIGVDLRHINSRNTQKSSRFLRSGDVELRNGTNSLAPNLFFAGNTLFPKVYSLGQPITVGLGSGKQSVHLWYKHGRPAYCLYFQRFPPNYASGGPFGAPNGSGILGFVLGDRRNGQIDGRGWLRVIVSDRNNDGYADQAEVVDWAFNNTAGGAINAGQTADPIPEPGTTALALLASGAAGLMTWRKRRKEKEAELAASPNETV